MRENKLPPRLAELAGLVRPGARVADIGTDHGLVPVWLAQTGIAAGIIAADIRQKPLRAAMRHAESAGVSDKIRFILCDGLDGIAPHDADTVIIAGMGGENIAGILKRAPRILETGPSLILQPQTRPDRLRQALAELDFKIISESLVSDSGVIYPVLAAGPGGGDRLTAAELLVGKTELISGHPLFKSYLSEQIRKTARALDGLERAQAGDALRCSGLRDLLDELRACSHKR